MSRDVVSSPLFPGAALGALFGGPIADRLGRKRTLLLCACIFLVGAIGCALAPNVQIMVEASSWVSVWERRR